LPHCHVVDAISLGQASQRPAFWVQAACLIDLFIGQTNPTSLDAETSKQ
jgi:hypothetical protein